MIWAHSWVKVEAGCGGGAYAGRSLRLVATVRKINADTLPSFFVFLFSSGPQPQLRWIFPPWLARSRNALPDMPGDLSPR